jgi:hypothetical protein
VPVTGPHRRFGATQEGRSARGRLINSRTGDRREAVILFGQIIFADVRYWHLADI